jgi:CRP-like cAMP-binding protein
MTSTEATERFLNAPWLADLDPTSRQALLMVLQEGRAPAGAALLSQGQPNDRVTFLIDGSVELIRNEPGRPRESVAVLDAPTVFGVTSFFGHNRSSTISIEARTSVWYLTLDRLAYSLLRRSDPRASEQFMHAVVRVLAERFDMLDRRVSQVLAQRGDGAHADNELAAFRARLFEESQL